MKRIAPIIFVIAFIFPGTNYLVAQWTKTGGPEGGNISAIIEDDLFIYAATPGRIFQMEKNGASWIHLRGPSATSLAQIGTTLVAGTSGGGVFRSTDHGMTWDRWVSGLDQAETVFSFAVNGNDLFAGTNRGVYLSTDHGANWTPANIGQDSLLVLSIFVKDSNIFAGTMGGGMYRSSDYGTNWAPVSSDMIPDSAWVWSIALMDNTMFAGTWGGVDGVYRSTDNGTTWVVVNNGLQEGGERDVNALAVLGQTLYAGTQMGIFVTEDGGNNWTSTDLGIGTIVNCFHISGTDIFAGAFDGVHLSIDSGDNWTIINSGLIGTQINVLLRTDTTLFAGTQYNDLFRSDDNGANWVKMNLWAPNLSSLVASGTDLFVGTSWGVSRSTDGGYNWSPANAGMEEVWISSLAVILNAGDEYLFAGAETRGVFLSIDKGASWTPVNSGLADTSISCLAVIGNNLYAGTESGMFLSQNYGTSWTPINTGMGNRPVQCLATSSGNLFAGTGSGVFLSTNNGTSWMPVNTGLTDLNVLCLAATDTTVFAGTWFDGVFLSENNGETWAPVNPRLRAPPVLSFDFSATDIFAGTRGSGVWRCPIDSLSIDSKAPELTVASADQLSLFPNPTNNQITIQTMAPGDYFMEIFSMSGQSIYSRNFLGISTRIDLSSFQKGIYIITISSEDFVTTEKIIRL